MILRERIPPALWSFGNGKRDPSEGATKTFRLLLLVARPSTFFFAFLVFFFTGAFFVGDFLAGFAFAAFLGAFAATEDFAEVFFFADFFCAGAFLAAAFFLAGAFLVVFLVAAFFLVVFFFDFPPPNAASQPSEYLSVDPTRRIDMVSLLLSIPN